MPDEAVPTVDLPSISVVVCAFTPDRIPVLDEALDSLAAQSRPPLEVILVIDHAPELLAEAERRWPRVKVLANRERQGLSGARNTGVEEARGDVVAFLDDDAIAQPDWLERIAAAYRDPRVLGAGGTVRPRWVEGKPDWFPPEFDWVVGCTHSGMPRKTEPVRNLVGANMSFRRSTLEEVGGFSHDLGRVGTLPVGCEETDLSIRVGQRSAEGRSKAVLTRLVGSRNGLESERSYARRTLPLGFLKGLRDAARGDLSGLARAAMIVVGLLATSAGYLRTRLRRGEARL